MTPGTRVRFKWPLPEFEEWTDQAIAGLVGQECRFTVAGRPQGRVRVSAAHRGPEDDPHRHLVVEVEGIEGDAPDAAVGLIFGLPPDFPGDSPETP